MAKGNDGNYLQHSIELAAAKHLATANSSALHVALAHGMAPFEPFERKLAESAPGHPSRCRVKAALGLAAAPQRTDEPLIVTAYRKAEASDEHYPNSAELLRTLPIGERSCKRGGCLTSLRLALLRTLRIGGRSRGLCGGVSETCPEKHRQLAAAWAGSSLRTARASWRREVQSGGVLACPKKLKNPWLFTMDPMTYREGGNSDDYNLHKHDITPLSEALKPYVQSGQPGMVALFAYNVWPEQRRRQFWDFVDELARQTGAAGVRRHWLTHQGGSRNLAALLFSAIDVPEDFLQDAVEEIEDVALVAAIQESEREHATWEAISNIWNGNESNSTTQL